MKLFRYSIALGLAALVCLQQANADVSSNRVVLITSFNPVQNSWIRQEYYRTHHLYLEKNFRDFFAERGYSVDVFHFASQALISEALRTTKNQAVFVVAHANESELNAPGLAQRALVDQYGYDLTGVFKSAHPGLRFLSVIGCNYEKELKRITEKYLLPHNLTLATRFFDHKIDGLEGLKSSMEQSVPHLTATRNPNCPQSQGYPLKIVRNIQSSANEVWYPSVRVEMNDHLLGVFPNTISAQAQELTVHIPKNASDAQELKILITAGANPNATSGQINLGEFWFSQPWKGASWTAFSSHSGKPIGMVTNVFRYTGTLDRNAAPEFYSPYICD